MPDPKGGATDAISRREFTLQSALALLAGVVITVDGCGGSSSTTAPTPTVQADVSGTVSANHGHTATIAGAQITAASAFALNIQGTATHPHDVALTQADLVALRSRTTVTKDSTLVNNHTHTVTFTPA